MPLGFLSNAGLERGICRPTWVPTWTPDNIGLLGPWSLGDSFRASQGLNFQRWPTENPEILAVNGIAVSTITWTSPEYTASLANNRQAFRGKMNTTLFELLPKEPRKQLARAFTVGRNAYGAPEADRSAFTDDFAAFLRKSGDSNIIHFKKSRIGENAQRFLDVADVVCSRRKQFVTASGHLGYGP